MALARLQSLLADYGIKVQDYDQPWETQGYPVVLSLRGGHRVVADVGEPGLLSSLDPAQIGIALVSPNGRIKQRWGLAHSIEILNPENSIFDSELASLVYQSLTDDTGGSLYLNGVRFFVNKTLRGKRTSDVAVLCTAAEGERQAMTQRDVQSRSAEMFRRIGKALAMHQTLNELAVLAVHELASAGGLAAAALWSRGVDDEQLLLRAHVGINRQGVELMETLEPRERLSCCAELVANRRQTLWVHSIPENTMASALEAKVCYLRPGSAVIIPLIVGDRLIGVLELVGREGDSRFSQNRESFEIIAEHLALALNTCLMFETVERMASFDPLTGVANHRALQDFLLGRVAESERTGNAIGVVMLDVDHFRAFNEEEGHDAGDAVLKLVAEAIKSAVRPYDLPARYGGEEFSIIMPGLDLNEAKAVAERVRQAIERIEFTTAGGRVRHVSASLGVASYPETSREPLSLIKAADLALFKSKRAGRNRVTVFEGAFKEEEKDDSLDLRWMERWMEGTDAQLSEQYFEFCRPFVVNLVQRLGLNKNQASILEQLVRIYPSYKRMMLVDDPEITRQLELCQEFRPLLPSLMMVGERFDGKGSMNMQGAKIPLLARCLAVLLALVEEKGWPLINDPSRFDPEIVSIIADVQQAA